MALPTWQGAGITISQCAQESLELLESWLPSFEGNIYNQAEEQLGRLYLWASNIGVFASRRASLDYRLRDAPEVANVIIGMLEVIQVHVRRGECSYPR
jgi:hypothetical protein